MRCVLCGELGYTVPFGVAQIGVRDDEPVEYACLAGCAGHDVESGLGVLARAGVHQDDVAVGQSRRYGGGRITGSAARQSGSSLALQEVRARVLGCAHCAHRAVVSLRWRRRHSTVAVAITRPLLGSASS